MHQDLINFEFARTDIQSGASEYVQNELGILVNTSQVAIQTTRMHSQLIIASNFMPPPQRFG